MPFSQNFLEMFAKISVDTLGYKNKEEEETLDFNEERGKLNIVLNQGECGTQGMPFTHGVLYYRPSQHACDFCI